MATGISTGGWAANSGISGVSSALCTDGGYIENVSISIKSYRSLAAKGVSLAGGHILSGGLCDCLSTHRFIGPGGNSGSTGHGISGAVPIQIGGIQPQSKVGDGVFVQRGVGGYEGLHGAPGCACRSNCLGGVVVSGAGGESGQCMGYYAHTMGTGDRLAVIPVSGSGASIVVSPVEGDGCIFTTQIDCGLIGVCRVVGVSRSEHRADQAPFAGEVTLDFETLGFWNHAVEDKELGDLTLVRSISTKVESLRLTLVVATYRLISGYLKLISPRIGNM